MTDRSESTEPGVAEGDDGSDATGREPSADGVDREVPADGDRDPSSDGDDEPEPDGSDESDHLAGIEAGAGCTEIWEHLSERREAERRRTERSE
ncbi:MAG: hypothetical protein R6U01_00590 [Halorubrum sp.]|uniref:hypothetical protein n=1 Tax=Halorubrum sp. TaxID=1879286 RepID=UPI003970D531